MPEHVRRDVLKPYVLRVPRYEINKVVLLEHPAGFGKEHDRGRLADEFRSHGFEILQEVWNRPGTNRHDAVFRSLAGNKKRLLGPVVALWGRLRGTVPGYVCRSVEDFKDRAVASRQRCCCFNAL